MKFGFQVPTAIEGLYMKPGAVAAGDLAAIARESERLGFDSLWVNDHVAPWPKRLEENRGQPLNWYEVLTTLAYCAAVTSRIKLAVGIVVMPFRDPVILAKQAATLDVLSGGRLLLGLGLGGAREEFEMLQPRLARASRSAILDEGLEAVKRLLTGEKSSFEGRHYSYRDVALHPRPAQDPLPIYISGNRPSAFRRVARYGSGYISMAASLEALRERINGLHQAMEAEGRDPGDIDVVLSSILCIDETHERALERFRSSMLGWRFSTGYEATIGHHLVGSPDEVAEKIRQLEGLGVKHVAPQHVAGDTVPQFMEQMYLLATEVLPLFRGS